MRATEEQRVDYGDYAVCDSCGSYFFPSSDILDEAVSVDCPECGGEVVLRIGGMKCVSTFLF